MSKTSDDEKGHWEQVMENFDLAFQQMNDKALHQQEIKKDLQATKEEQRLIAKQVQANGQAVASLTLWTMETEAVSEHQDDASIIFYEEENDFQNIFAAKKKSEFKAESSKHPRHHRDHHHKENLPNYSLPKIQFPKFDGSQPKIWFDNCANYFIIYSVPDRLKVTTTTMHLEGNAAKWWQAYKQNHTVPNWSKLCEIIQEKFGASDYKDAIHGLPELRQTGTVEEYTEAFQALQYDITMHNCPYDDLFFASTYVAGLKEEIRAVVEPHDPATVEKATTIAKIQQRTIARNKTKATRNYAAPRAPPPKFDQPRQPNNLNLQRIRQLRDYRRANNLCYSCGEKFELVIKLFVPRGNNHK